MRVLIVPKWYPWPDQPVWGLFCREQAEALSTAHDVVVMAPLAVPNPGFALYKLTDGFEDGLRTVRVRYRRPRLRPLALVCQTLGMVAALARLRREGWRPDVVHAHVYSAGLPALVLGALSRAPVVITEHYTAFVRGLITGYERLLARIAFERAALVAPVSDDLAAHLYAIAPGARMVTVPNVVDTETFAAPDPPRGHDHPPRLVNVAALAEKKGHVHLLEAMTELDEATLEVIGDGELRESLERRARELGLGDRVVFAGERPKAKVAERMRAADLFVLPSLAETFGVVLIEAMATGLPSVATRVGGVPEVLSESTGVLVAPADSGALAAGIRAALKRDFDPEAMAATAERSFGRAAFVERWTGLYAELASSRGSSSSATRRRTSASE